MRRPLISLSSTWPLVGVPLAALLLLGGQARGDAVLKSTQATLFPTKVEIKVRVTAQVEVTEVRLHFPDVAQRGDYALTVPRHFVGAASVFELQMHLQKNLAGKTDRRAKVRALAFTGEYLGLIPKNRSQAQKALDRVTRMNGLPKLNMWQVQNAIAGDHVIGEKQVTKLQRLVDQAGR